MHRDEPAFGHGIPAPLERLEDRLLLTVDVSNPISDFTVAAQLNDQSVDLFNVFTDPDAIYRFTLTNSVGTANDFFDVDLFETQTPITVANFRAYADSGDWVNTLIHRAVSGFIIQGGGFNINPASDAIGDVTSRGQIQNEPGISNTRGTIAMAKVGGNPNSATSEWFFNLGDNSANLDNQNGGFTAFGEVLGDGMDVIDAIAALNRAVIAELPTDTNNPSNPLVPVLDNTANPVLDDTNLISFSSIREALTFTVLSSDPSIVSASIDADGILTLDYNDAAKGEATITVTATDVDGNDTEEQFTVTTEASTRPDLAVQSVTDDIATQISPDTTTDGTINVTIENLGDVDVPEGTEIPIGAVLRPVGNTNDSQDIIIGVSTVTVGSGDLTSLGGTLSGSIPISIPVATNLDEYEIRVVLDTLDVIDEPNETNNDQVSSTVTIANNTDLSPTSVTASLSSSGGFYSQTGNLTGTASVTILNRGLDLTGTTTIDVGFAFRPLDATDDSQDIDLGSVNVDLVDLDLGDTQTLTGLALTIPDLLPIGSFVLVAKVNQSDTPAEDNTNNNEAETSATVFTVQAGRDLSISLDTNDLPSTITRGTVTDATADITVINVLESLDAGQQVSVQFFLRPVGATDNTGDIIVGTQDLTLGALDFLGTESFAGLGVTVPADTAVDAYNLVAVIDSNNALGEFNENNNEAVDAGVVTIVAQERLSSVITATTLPLSLPYQREFVAEVTLSITNNGVTIPAGQDINVDFFLRSSSGDTAPIGSVLIDQLDGLATGDTQVFENLQVTIPSSIDITGQGVIDLAPDEALAFELIANVDTGSVLDSEPREADNVGFIGFTVINRADLAVVLDSFTGITDGQIVNNSVGASGTVTFDIRNNGINTPGSFFDEVPYHVVLRPTGGGLDRVISNPLTINLEALAPDAVETITDLDFSVPDDIAPGEYQVIVTVNPVNAVSEASNLNNEVILATITVDAPDLTATITGTTLPAAIPQADTPGTVTIDLINNGQDVGATVNIDAEVFLRPAAGPDISIGTATGIAIDGLATGSPQSEVINVNIPASQDLGEYTLVVIVDTGDAVTETDETNNAVTGDTITIADAPDLTGAITATSLPLVLDQSATAGTVTVDLINNGLTVGNPVAIDVEVFLRPADDSGDISIGTSTGIDISDLTAGSPQSAVISINIPAALALGTYTLVVAVDTGDSVAETDETNNTVTGGTITIADGPDLSATITGSTLPTAVDQAATAGTITIDLINNGVVLGNPVAIDIQVALRPTNAVDDSSDITIGSSLALDVSDLAAGTPQSEVINVNIPTMTVPGDYILVVKIDTGDDVIETSEDNNTVAGNTITVNAPDLTGQFTAVTDFERFLVLGADDTGNSVTLRIDNAFLAIPSATSIGVSIVLRPAAATDASIDVLLNTDTIDISSLAAGGSTTPTVISADITGNPSTLPVGDYRVIAILDTGDVVTEQDETNNLVIGPTVTIVLGPDLTGTLSQPVVSGFIDGAGGTITTTLSLTIGLIDVPGGQSDITVTFGLRAESDPDSSPFVTLDTTTVVIAGETVGTVIDTVVNLTLNSSTAVGLYEVVGFIDSSTTALTDPGDLTEENETNNIASGAFITVGEPTVVSGNEIADISTNASAGNQTINLFDVFDHGSNLYRTTLLNTLAGQADSFFIQLFDAQAPNTVLNFLNYAERGDFNSNFFHRLATGSISVLQAGGFTFDTISDRPIRIQTDDPVDNEPGISNTRGTIAMAKVMDDPNSATSQWFINLSDDNAGVDAITTPDGLDFQNGGFTVFGQVIKGSMDLIDAIADRAPSDLRNILGNGVFSETPLIDSTLPGGLEDNLFIFESLNEDLAFSLSNDNPAVVNAIIDNVTGELTLDFVNGGSGTATITVTATDSDGLTAQDTFTITTSAEPDLSGVITSTTLDPDERLPVGRTHNFNASVELTNPSATALPASQQVAVTFVLRPEGSPVSLNDITLRTLLVDVSNLAPSATTALNNVRLTIPEFISQGRYELLAIIDSGNDLAESNEANNTASAGAGINTIIELDQPAFDLGIAFGSALDLPSTTLTSGDGTRIRVPIEITNLGNDRIPNRAATFASFYARPSGTAGSSEDILLTVNRSSFIRVNASSLNPGQSRRINTTIELPPDMPIDDYRIIAVLDPLVGVFDPRTGEFRSESNLTDTAFTNNEVVSIGTIDVVTGSVDFSASIRRETLPDTTLAAESIRATVSVDLTNVGNIRSANGATATIEVRAILGSTEVVLGSAENVRLPAINPGQSRTINVRLDLPDGLPQSMTMSSETWTIEAEIVELNGITDDNPSNDTTDFTIEVANRAVDLTITLDDTTVPASAIGGGDGSPIRLRATVTNEASDLVPAGSSVEVRVYASTDGDPANTDNVLLPTHNRLQEGTIVNLSNLRAGQSKQVNLTVAVPPGINANMLDDGDYFLIVEVDSLDDVEESDGTPASTVAEDNNTDTSASTIAIVNGAVDMVASLDRVSLPPAVLRSQSFQGSLRVIIENTGTTALAAGQKVDIEIQIVRVSGGSAVTRVIGTAENVSVSRLDAARSISRNVRISSDGLPSDGVYEVRAVINAQTTIDEDNTDNNTSALNQAGSTVSMVVFGSEYKDISLAYGSRFSLPTSAVTAGSNTRLSMPVELTNLGNVNFDRGATATLTYFARPIGASDGSDDYRLSLTNNQTSLTTSISNLRPGQVKNANANVTLPGGMPTGNYTIIVEATATGERTSNLPYAGAPSVLGNNRLTSTTLLTVLNDNTTDLAISATTNGFDSTTPLVGTITAIISNVGSTRIAANQLIDLQVIATNNATTAQTTLLTVQDVSIASLASGSALDRELAINASALATGTYTIELIGTPKPSLIETSASNNRTTVFSDFDIA
ncbi:MAG: peptidylprolyl isomerase [Phycisphaeraceae bacterium]